MAYTYNDFLSELNRTGAKLSDADMETARKYPEFGLSLLSLGEDYNRATTPEQKTLAHEAAEELRRSYGGYSGGGDGSGYKVTTKAEKQTSDALDGTGAVGSFRYDEEAPTYVNPYAEQQKQLLDQVMDQGSFSWSKEEDPLWGSYKKSYLREGERAEADALAKAAAASGGRPSTWAVTAAGQAGDYYAAQLNDVIPTLEQRAYERHQGEQAALLEKLGVLNTQEQMDYAKYLDALGQFNTDRSFALNQYLSDMDVQQAKLSAAQGQAATEYQKYLAEVEQDTLKEQESRALAQGQVDAILKAGGMPSGELVAASGYSEEYVKALAAAMAGTGKGTAAAGAGYDNEGLDEEIVRTMQNLLGLEPDGKWGPNSRAMTGMGALATYQAMVNDGMLSGDGPESPGEETPAPDLPFYYDADNDEAAYYFNSYTYATDYGLQEAIRNTPMTDEQFDRLLEKLQKAGIQVTVTK